MYHTEYHILLNPHYYNLNSVCLLPCIIIDCSAYTTSVVTFFRNSLNSMYMLWRQNYHLKNFNCHSSFKQYRFQRSFSWLWHRLCSGGAVCSGSRCFKLELIFYHFTMSNCLRMKIHPTGYMFFYLFVYTGLTVTHLFFRLLYICWCCNVFSNYTNELNKGKNIIESKLKSVIIP